MTLNGWLRRAALALLTGVAGVAGAGLGYAEGGSADPAAAAELWQVAGALRGELLAMLAAAERGEGAQAGHHAAGAAATYARMRGALAAVAPEADRAITGELQALTLLGGPRLARRALARGRVLGTVAAGAQRGAVTAAAAGAAGDAQAWLALREYRRATRVTLVHSAATQAVRRMAAGDLAPDAAAAIVRDDLYDTYHARLRYAAAAARQAAARGLAARAAESAGLIAAYLTVLGADYGAKLGAAAGAALDAAVERLTAAALAADFRGVDAAAGDVLQLWKDYQAVDLPAAELARRASLVQLFLDLTAIEYRDGVRAGRITIAAEYQEAVVFLEQAALGAAELAPRIAAVDPVQAEELERLLAELANHVTDLGPVPRVRELSAQGQAIVAATLGTSGAVDADSVFTVIGQLLDSVDGAVRNGAWEVAERTRIQAYGLFDAGPELALLALDPPLAARVDALFWSGAHHREGLATVIAAQAPFPRYLAAAGELRSALLQAQGVLARDAAPAAVAANAALIVFREGLEAVVILAALVASLVGAAAVFRRPLYLGAAAALVASAATGVAARLLVHTFRMLGERLEAIVSLVAIAVLLLITNWFFHKVYWSGWIARFHGHKRTLLAGAAGQMMGFALLGFVSVYREGFETALFLQALFLRAGNEVVLAGVVLGALAAGAVGVVTLQLEKKLPHKKMLVVTGVLIGAVLITLVGSTVHVMQAVGWLPVTPMIGVAIPYWLGSWFGVYPTWQTCLGQLAAAAFVLASYYAAKARSRRAPPRSAAAETVSWPRRMLAGRSS